MNGLFSHITNSGWPECTTLYDNSIPPIEALVSIENWFWHVKKEERPAISSFVFRPILSTHRTAGIVKTNSLQFGYLRTLPIISWTNECEPRTRWWYDIPIRARLGVPVFSTVFEQGCPMKWPRPQLRSEEHLQVAYIRRVIMQADCAILWLANRSRSNDYTSEGPAFNYLPRLART